MMDQVSIEVIAIALVVIVGLFVVIRSLSMPKSFSRNEIKREELRRKKIEEELFQRKEANDEDAKSA